MALTDLQIRNLKCPEGKNQCKKTDGNGLFILAKANGSKLWRFRYKFAGKHQELSFGRYPNVPLTQARKLAVEARAKLIQGVNPAIERKEQKRESVAATNDFYQVAIAWWENQSSAWSDDYVKRVRRWIDVHMKSINKLSIDEIDQGHLTDIVLAMEEAGISRNCQNVIATINRIYGYALANRLTRNNPAQNFPLSDIIKPIPKVKHHAAITKPTELGKLIRDIDTCDSGAYCTVQALRLIPRLFLRPNEIRNLKWDYVDFDDKIIRIPSSDMKRDREHLVPLATQVIEQLKQVKEVTGYSDYVFPSQRNSDNPMSKNVMTNLLRKLGYGADQMTAHGFRSTASTLLHEQGWSHDAIEAQLAHLTGTATSRAYNRSIHIKERTEIMQAWADYLDSLKNEKHNKGQGCLND